MSCQSYHFDGSIDLASLREKLRSQLNYFAQNTYPSSDLELKGEPGTSVLTELSSAHIKGLRISATLPNQCPQEIHKKFRYLRQTFIRSISLSQASQELFSDTHPNPTIGQPSNNRSHTATWQYAGTRRSFPSVEFRKMASPKRASHSVVRNCRFESSLA